MTDVPMLAPKGGRQSGCNTPGCDRPHHGRGLCRVCWSRAYYHANHEHALATRRAARQKRAAKRKAAES
jgi:hypothetical protein